MKVRCCYEKEEIRLELTLFSLSHFLSLDFVVGLNQQKLLLLFSDVI